MANAEQALADLMEISSQVNAAVLVDDEGGVAGSAGSREGSARALARAARELLDAAAGIRSGGDQALTQLEVATREGSVFVVGDGERVIAATTGPSPTVGLVFYDLKTCLRSLAVASEEASARKKPRAHGKAPPKATKATKAPKAPKAPKVPKTAKDRKADDDDEGGVEAS